MILFCAITLCIGSLYAEPILSQDESLQLKRIAEFWKDGDFTTAKRQIIDFLSRHGESSASDPLYAMLGDLYFHEKNYYEACVNYRKIRALEFQSKTLLNHLKALFELKEYASVESLASPYCERSGTRHPEEEIYFLYAQVLFKQGVDCADADRQQILLQKAKLHYEKLSDPRFTDFALLPLAEIYRLLQDYTKAASLYLLLAQKFPSQEEDFLFQAASLYAHSNKSEAVQLFNAVYQKRGGHASTAAFNQLLLLFEAEAYSEVVQRCEPALKDFAPEHFSTARFYVGMSHYYLKHFPQAAAYLEEFIENEKSPSPNTRTALLHLITCSRELDDIELCGRNLKRFYSHYPTDVEYPKALLIHAHMALEQGYLEDSQRDLQTLIDSFPNCDEREEILYEHAMLLMHNKKWAEARKSLLHFLDQYPNNERRASGWRNVLLCTLQDKNNPQYKNQLVEDLNASLKVPDAISREERVDYLFLLAKTVFELRQYDKALEHLSAFALEYPQHPKTASTHLMQALSIEQVTGDFSLFAKHIETALTLDPTLLDTPFLHIELYNAYLHLAQKEGDQLAFLDKAAEQLFQAIEKGYNEIKLDNLLWLANHYYAKTAQEPASSEKAASIFEKLLQRHDDPIAIEAEYLKYADLLSSQNKISEGISLLESLLTQQAAAPQLHWKFQRHAMLELGKSYEKMHLETKALKCYDEILSAPTPLPSYLQSAALLQRSRLRFALLDAKQQREEDPAVMDILSSLKDLQIRKKIASEPLHLEAALSYATIRAMLSPPSVRNERAIFFLKRMREDFLAQDDPIAKEYHAAKAKFPEKEKLLQHYLDFVEAESLRLQAEEARRNHQAELAIEQERRSLQILNTLQGVPSLKAHVKKSMEALIK